MDTSVVLAHLLAEDRRPADSFWDHDGLITGRPLEYEAWDPIHARGLGASPGQDPRAILGALSSSSWCRPSSINPDTLTCEGAGAYAELTALVIINEDDTVTAFIFPSDVPPIP
ncbi:MAG: hypothetical protein R3C32_04465 [Chloroflexota bacterium]